MRVTEEQKPLVVWMWGLASVPAVWLIAFGLFILRARLSLGQWPAPYQPDPKDLGFDFHYAAVVAGMPLMLAAVLVVTVLAPMLHRQSARRWWIPAVAVGSMAGVILLARADPGGVFTWLGD